MNLIKCWVWIIEDKTDAANKPSQSQHSNYPTFWSEGADIHIYICVCNTKYGEAVLINLLANVSK